MQAKMKLVIVLALLHVVYSYKLLETSVKEEDEDAKLPVPELITKYGYPVEVHQITTPDGYILTMHRIPHGKNPNKVNNKVLLLQHGLLSSSADWIIAGTEKGLGYIMADEGYDVWLGNARGNTYSRNHTIFDPDKDPEFWHFSWHEIGIHDLPTMIDHMLETTGVESIYYVGHSQGTTSFFVMNSMKPEYNDKIKVQVSMAPIGFMNHMTSPILHLVAFFNGPLDVLLPLIGINEFCPSSEFMAQFGDLICGDDDITQLLCTNAMFAICGFSASEMNATLLPVLMGHTPAGSATRQVLHYTQEISSGHFRQYDFGTLENMSKYNSLVPPDYDLSKVTAPVYMLYSHNDWLAGETDVTKLCDKISNCDGKFLVSDATFNHLDYMFGMHAKEVAYDTVISLLDRH